MIGTYDDLCPPCRAILEERERLAPRLDKVHQQWVDRHLLQKAICRAESIYGTAALTFRAIKEGVQGAMAECGVAAGVHPAVMHYCMRYAGQYRDIWLFDSFEGIPRPTRRDVPSEDRPGRDAREFLGNEVVPDGVVTTNGRAGVPLDEVKLLMRTWGAKDEQLRYAPGWFHETMPGLDVGPLALLRLDADVYESTNFALTHLYPHVSPGGYVLVHDYDLAGVRAAVVDALGCEPKVHDFPGTGPEPRSVWWRK